MTASVGGPSPAPTRAERLRPLLMQFGRFLVVGLLSFTFDYGLFVLLYRAFDVQYVVASTISFSLSVVLNYVLTRRFVFDANPDRHVGLEFVLYLGLNIVALGLNQLILFLTVDSLGISPLIGKLIATAVVLVYNFVSRKLLLERPRPKRGEVVETAGSGPAAAGGSRV